MLDAKGDLISASAANTPALVTVGANDSILMADSAQAAGLKWVDPATPSTQAFGDAAAEGTSDTFTRGDHKHAMPADPVTAHNTAAAAHGSAWTTWTPVVEQDTGNSVAVTVNTARYRQIGKIVFFEVGMTVTGTGNANNEIITTLPPVAPQADWYGVPMIFGSGFVEDNSAGFLYPCFGVIVSSTAYRLRSTASGIGTAFLGNNQFTAALTASDLIRFSGWYEAA